MPKVSIILPTFNRADTIMRAIKSAQAQTFRDWELIIVDDGSTDNTATLIADIDPRITLIRQENRGFTEARNTAIRASKGTYFAFLDSDDEFLPYHLELCIAFLEAHAEEQFVSTELLEDFGHGRVVNHYRIETSEWYPQKAALIRSHCFDLPPDETDNYLRAYQSREPIGAWGNHIVSRVAPQQAVFLYRGMIFKHIRFDFLIAITASVIRRSAFETLGLPESRWFTGSDYHFLGRLCKTFRANFLSIPTFVKHEYGVDGTLPRFGHVVSGKSALRFAQDFHNAWEDLFWNEGSRDAETHALRSLRQFWMAKIALGFSRRDLTLQWLKEAREGLPCFWRAIALYWFVRCIPGIEVQRKTYRVLDKITNSCRKLFRGEFSPRLLMRKALALVMR
jgi:glycosyltransferase involved in cell wall biosynthesis